MKKNVRILLGISISIVLVYFSFRNINIGRSINILISGNWIYIIPAIIFFYVSVYFRSYKWKEINRLVTNTDFRDYFNIYSSGLAINNVTALRIGDIVKSIIVANKYKAKKVNTLLCSFIDKLFDLLSLSIILIFILVFFTSLNTNPELRNKLYILSFSVVALFILLCVFIINIKRIFNIVKNFTNINFIHHAIKKIQNTADDILLISHSPKTLSVILLMSIIAWILEGTSYYFLFKILNINISYAYVIVVASILSMSTAIPSAGGYIGTYDYIMIMLLKLSSITTSLNLILTVVLITHFIVIVPITISGGIFFFIKKYYINIRK